MEAFPLSSNDPSKWGGGCRQDDAHKQNRPFVLGLPTGSSPLGVYKKLIETVYEYRPGTDISMIEKAYRLANDLHKDQKRKSGEPYIIHPICVAIILAEFRR